MGSAEVEEFLYEIDVDRDLSDGVFESNLEHFENCVHDYLGIDCSKESNEFNNYVKWYIWKLMADYCSKQLAGYSRSTHEFERYLASVSKRQQKEEAAKGKGLTSEEERGIRKALTKFFGKSADSLSEEDLKELVFYV